jgi:hypothetical protein
MIMDQNFFANCAQGAKEDKSKQVTGGRNPLNNVTWMFSALANF